ncbi:MAG: hypothetical protein K0U84_01720 [Actinomycetia bacterium]|nr:hypothetical protein [Actinomycetes bacterium]
MTPLERVAEAIWRKDRPDEPFDQCLFPDYYRGLAQAAIDALQLTEEWKTTCDRWNGGGSIYPTREEAWERAVESSQPRLTAYASLLPPPPLLDEMRLESRLVSPWERDQ